MLLRFSVTNFLSMRDRQELSLAVSSLKDTDEGLIDAPMVPSGKVLPVAMIYGANASGKSNLLEAIHYMRSAVLNSHREGKPGGGISRVPFALDPEYANTPSVFEIDFIVYGIRYHYGFEATDEEYVAEWLFSFPKGRRQTLFERTDKTFKFGRELKGRNRVIEDLTRPNSLFVSAAAQNHHKQLSKVAEFFRSMFGVTAVAISGEIASLKLADNELDNRVIDFLKSIGSGVVDYQRQESELTEEMKALNRDVFSVLQKYMHESIDFDLENQLNVEIKLGHTGKDGKSVFFDLDRESAGTRRLLVILGHVFHALDQGNLLVIDELDSSLHTQACDAILALFASRKTNPKGAQLITTTHDTNLLCSPLLRRDEIWFTEKDDEGATSLYPLSDIRTRKGDNIEKGYLQGRYGAVPFSGSITDLVDAG